jgi:hypothetical protein
MRRSDRVVAATFVGASVIGCSLGQDPEQAGLSETEMAK